MNVRFDKGWHYQITAGVEVLRTEARGFGLASDAGDQAVFQVQFMQAFAVAKAGVDDVHQASPSQRSCRGVSAARVPNRPSHITYVSAPVALPNIGRVSCRERVGQ